MARKANEGGTMQQPAKGGLDSIFARMAPGLNDDSIDRIDEDDEGDGNLLTGQDDSLYGSRYDWKRDKR